MRRAHHRSKAARLAHGGGHTRRRRRFRIPRGLFGAEETVLALDGIDLSIEEGSFVALIGPSGCGKSTLLRIVAGLDAPDEGTVEVAARARGEVAYVFQDAHLLPWRSVAANVALPLELRGVPREEREAAVKQALEEVELSDAASRYPGRALRRHAHARVASRARSSRARSSSSWTSPSPRSTSSRGSASTSGSSRVWQEHA